MEEKEKKKESSSAVDNAFNSHDDRGNNKNQKKVLYVSDTQLEIEELDRKGEWACPPADYSIDIALSLSDFFSSLSSNRVIDIIIITTKQ